MLLLRQTVPTGLPGSHRNRLRCPKYRRRQIAPGRRTAPRTKHEGHVGYRRDGLVAIPEEEEVQQEVEELQERDFSSEAEDSTYYYHRDSSPPEKHEKIPSQVQLGEREHCPVTLRWESPKSTIQLEDLLFGIGSQFDDMPFSPRQLSYIHSACDQNSEDRQQPPNPSLASSMAPAAGAARGPDFSTTQAEDMAPVTFYEDADGSDSDTYADESTAPLVDKGKDSSCSPLLYEDLPVATAAPKPSPGLSYLRRLSGTLASTMRRVYIGLWNLLKWKICNGIRVHSSGSRRGLRQQQQQQQQQGGLEKYGGRGGVIYLA